MENRMLLILSLNKTLLQNLWKYCLSGFLCSVFLIQAQTGPYPNKQIKVVVSFTAGGTSDILAREVSTQLSQRFNVPVIIENKPGAAGNLGTEIVGKSAPDGYTLLVNSIGPIAINPTLFKSLPVNPQKELDPVALLAEVPTVLVVYPGLGVNTAA
jgi:tripartite-type tricarboxylate transporter receptor subunit TctC